MTTREEDLMTRLFLTLEDGAVFEGGAVNDARDTAGLLSFFTGVVGYQEIISDPANLGKIIVYTYPLIGNYGVNGEDAESASPKLSGILAKEYPAYYSNFRATGSLADYLDASSVVFGSGFDTRAVMLHLREHGEMIAALSPEPMAAQDVKARAEATACPDYVPENTPLACAQARPVLRASVIDLGASRSLYGQLADMGVDATCSLDKADAVIVSDAPYYAVESSDVVGRVKSLLGSTPVIGFGHGSAIVASACGADVRRLSFGDHGVNIPVRSVGGGRNEITVQNHNYGVATGGVAEVLFENVHDGSCEGFVCREARAAGANFVPGEKWLEVLLKSVGVDQDA